MGNIGKHMGKYMGKHIGKHIYFSISPEARQQTKAYKNSSKINEIPITQ